MDQQKDRNLRAWVLVFGILLILSLIGLGAILTFREIARTVTDSALQAVAPINILSTQVARVINATPTIIPDPVTVIREVRSLARLESIQYSVEKVITAETGQGPFDFLFGDRLLFVAHGVVIAGVDLNKLEPDDVRVTDGVLFVKLPEPEIFIATLDNEKSYVFDRETGVLNRGDINLETNARRAAEEEIRNGAIEDGILDQARVNAENYLYTLFLGLGYEEVIFEGSEPQPTQTPTP